MRTRSVRCAQNSPATSGGLNGGLVFGQNRGHHSSDLAPVRIRDRTAAHIYSQRAAHNHECRATTAYFRATKRFLSDERNFLRPLLPHAGIAAPRQGRITPARAAAQSALDPPATFALPEHVAMPPHTDQARWFSEECPSSPRRLARLCAARISRRARIRRCRAGLAPPRLDRPRRPAKSAAPALFSKSSTLRSGRT